MILMATNRFNLRSLYLYAVCLATLLISLFAMTQLVRGTVEILYPDPYAVATAPMIVDDENKDAANRKAEEERGRAASRRWAILSLVSSGTMLLIAAPTYRYHWRLAQREHHGNEDGVEA